jgi:fucose permease
MLPALPLIGLGSIFWPAGHLLAHVGGFLVVAAGAGLALLEGAGAAVLGALGDPLDRRDARIEAP